MKCYRFDLWNFMSRYVTGELDTKTIQRLEDHLLDCNACRLRLSRLRDGQRFVMQLPHEVSRSDNWEALEAALEAEPTKTVVPPKRRKPIIAWRRFLTSPRFASAILGIAIIIFGLSFFLNKQKFGQHQAIAASSFDAS